MCHAIVTPNSIPQFNTLITVMEWILRHSSLKEKYSILKHLGVEALNLI